MKLHHLLITAAVVAFSACTGQAAPQDWVGKEFPAYTVDYLDKQPETKGKPVLVEFWATWCPPCKASIPHLNTIYKKHKDAGLVIIGVSDEDKDTIEKFRKNVPMDYTVAIDKKELGQKLGVQGIPHAFLIGKDGKVAWQGHPMRLTDADVEKVLK
jgi:cytochrome c biogenesis protein CcmG, thiol:disulfide interchange protein DsbE